MLIKTDEVDNVIRRLEDRDDLDETRLMYIEDEYLTVSMLGYPSMRLCLGHEDEQIFYAGELQPDRFTSIRLDHLHTLLTSVQNGSTPPRLLTDLLDRPMKGVIDLGVMIDEFHKSFSLNLPINKIGMTEQEARFNENQFRRTGFGEAYTPDVVTQMERGVPEIKKPFSKEYDGDKVNATLHLKKAANSNFYFLNKFDQELIKAGQTLAQAIRQTFYITSRSIQQESQPQPAIRHDNKYTLKEAYNLLSDRPVFKKLVTKDGQEYEAWVKLNFKNRLPGGNYEMKQYTKGYGFDLEYVLGKYVIEEMKNEGYKKSLMESLHRGNLQKVTFTDKDGKKEQLYISPNITMGSLNVYDANKQKLDPMTLREKQLIEKEFGEKLVERLQQIRSQGPAQEATPKEGLEAIRPSLSLVDPQQSQPTRQEQKAPEQRLKPEKPKIPRQKPKRKI